jgi:Tat protein secretion system quality control protein TatD with DNase activity
MKLKLPLVLHIREAEDEALRVLDEVNLPHDWPIHRCGLYITVSNITLLCDHVQTLLGHWRDLGPVSGLAGQIPQERGELT